MLHLPQPDAEIILASGSPRRRELLASLGLNFQVLVPNVDEETEAIQSLAPDEQVQTLAKQKAQVVAVEHPQALVIAADTLVVLPNALVETDRETGPVLYDDLRVLGKPKTPKEAHAMLSLLQGRWHTVLTGVTVCWQGRMQTGLGQTRVRMLPLSAQDITRYIATGEPMDKAGAYAIQGQGSLLIDRIEGCYFNVVGLPLALLNQLCQLLH